VRRPGHLAVPEAESWLCLDTRSQIQEAGHDEPMVRYLARSRICGLMLRVDMALGAAATIRGALRCRTPSIIVRSGRHQVPVGKKDPYGERVRGSTWAD